MLLSSIDIGPSLPLGAYIPGSQGSANHTVICVLRLLTLAVNGLTSLPLVIYTNGSQWSANPTTSNIYHWESTVTETKKLKEKSRECHNHKPLPTPDSKRKRQMIKNLTRTTNKQMHEKHTNQLPLPQAR